MKRPTTPTPASTILYCHCTGADTIDLRVRLAVLAGLRASGATFEPVGDLCGLAAARDPLLQRTAAGEDMRIAACHKRAVRWLFAAGGAPLPNEGVNIVNMIGRSAEQILDCLLPETARSRAQGDCESAAPPEPVDDWTPWFPVIDYDRCSGCKQCFNFCLFGVFELTDDDSVRVANPANCKLNCPACARICPETAIIFPKHASPPINGGEAAEGQPTEVDLPALLKGDVYRALRQRADIQTTQDVQRAMQEREKCCRVSNMLKKLGVAGELLQASECDCDCDPSDDDCCK